MRHWLGGKQSNSNRWRHCLLAWSGSAYPVGRSDSGSQVGGCFAVLWPWLGRAVYGRGNQKACSRRAGRGGCTPTLRLPCLASPRRRWRDVRAKRTAACARLMVCFVGLQVCVSWRRTSFWIPGLCWSIVLASTCWQKPPILGSHLGQFVGILFLDRLGSVFAPNLRSGSCWLQCMKPHSPLLGCCVGLQEWNLRVDSFRIGV